MWRPPIKFITIHCKPPPFTTTATATANSEHIDAWIIFAGLLGLIAIYPYGNVAAIDAYFLSASASTESGLNT